MTYPTILYIVCLSNLVTIALQHDVNINGQSQYTKLNVTAACTNQSLKSEINV